MNTCEYFLYRDCKCPIEEGYWADVPNEVGDKPEVFKALCDDLAQKLRLVEKVIPSDRIPSDHQFVEPCYKQGEKRAWSDLSAIEAEAALTL